MLTGSGCGQLDPMTKQVKTLSEAKKEFNRLKKDCKGWVGGGYLTTELQKVYVDESGEIQSEETEIVEAYQVRICR